MCARKFGLNDEHDAPRSKKGWRPNLAQIGRCCCPESCLVLGQITLDTEPQGSGASRFRVFPGKEADRQHEQFFLRQQFSTLNPPTLFRTN